MSSIKDQLGSWYDFMLSNSTMGYLEEAYNNVEILYENTTCYPIKENIFRAFKECDFKNVSVVIVAMDPFPNMYKGKPSACGLCFATENGFVNPSLRIITKELVNCGYIEPIDSVHVPRRLTNLPKQGVLMLNMALTVEQGKAGSHLKVWQAFTQSLITSLSKAKPDLIYLLMGKEAQQVNKNIITGTIIETVHPMVDVYSGKNNFVGSNCFVEINKQLISENKTPIIYK